MHRSPSPFSLWTRDASCSILRWNFLNQVSLRLMYLAQANTADYTRSCLASPYFHVFNTTSYPF
jgi:hypothetical protein